MPAQAGVRLMGPHARTGKGKIQGAGPCMSVHDNPYLPYLKEVIVLLPLAHVESSEAVVRV